MKKLSNLPNWVLISSASLVGIVFIVIASYFIFQERYKNKIYPGVRVAGINLGGLDYPQAREMIEEKIYSIDQGIKVSYNDRQIVIPLEGRLLNPDFINPVIFDSQATLKNVISIGRFEDGADNLFEQLSALTGRYSLNLVTTIDRVQITEQLKNSFSDLETPPQNATLAFDSSDEIKILPGKDGVLLQYDQAVNQLIEQFQAGNSQEVRLIAKTTRPEIAEAKVTDRILLDLEKFKKLPSLILTHQKKTWKVKPDILLTWLGLIKEGDVVTTGLDDKKVKDYLETEISPKITTEPVLPRIQLDNGRVTIWQAGQDGVSLNTEATFQAIQDWSHLPDQEVVIATNIIPNPQINKNAEELGLKEIIGTGVSHFAGSPKNRRHNIKVGADALNGILLKPGEEFSLLKTLGEIDAKSGYLPELVIKDNKTVPEYGGGLCQIGTTVFRATFNSGLPVTQRRNHSYRVGYYEPAGTDATIYDPAPDYRFRNDTGHHVLIQARLSGDDLAFDFWGTKDGREIEYTKPVIYNIVQPRPTKIVETTDLPEGVKKCTESAHAGADAYFDYTVRYSDGEVKKERFTSHYVPWQAVCLVGVKEKSDLSLPIVTPTSTITPSIKLDNNL